MIFSRGRLNVVPAAVAAVCLAIGGRAAMATPSGLSNYPSTDVYSKGNFHFDADYFTSTNGGTTTGSSIGLEYGAGPDRDGFGGRSEFGLDYITFPIANTNHGNRFLLNGKTQLFNNDASATRAVVGFYGVGSKRIAAGNWVYLLGSKGFDFGRVHVGVARSLASKSIIPTNRTVLQLGFDKAINKKFIFAFDYQSGKTQFIAPGIIYNINDKAGIEVSYLRGGSLVSPRDQIYFGFDYNFGGAGAPASTPDAPAGEGGAGGAGGGAGGGGGGGGGGG